jgi:hypothetical protein
MKNVMKIYISIPMENGRSEIIDEELSEVKRIIKDEYPDCEIAAPNDICSEHLRYHGECMYQRLDYIMKCADMVVFCKGWEDSKDCNTEMDIAKEYCKLPSCINTKTKSLEYIV